MIFILYTFDQWLGEWRIGKSILNSVTNSNYMFDQFFFFSRIRTNIDFSSIVSSNNWILVNYIRMNNTSELAKRQSSKITSSQNQTIRQVASLLPLYQSCLRGRARPLCHQPCLVFFTPVDCSPHRHRFSFSSFNAWQNGIPLSIRKEIKGNIICQIRKFIKKKNIKKDIG